MEGYTDPHDGDVILNVEMFVPSSHVGRIIGKGGANVRELQRLTGAMIKLPDQLSPPPKDQTSVVLIGKWIQVLVSKYILYSNLNTYGSKIDYISNTNDNNFILQTAQQRLRAMLLQTSNSNGSSSTVLQRMNGTNVAAKSSGDD